MGNNGSRRLPFYIIPMPLRSLHSFCSVRSHLLKSLERQILRIWEQREDFTPYLGTEGGFYSVFGNRGRILLRIWEQREYHHMEGTEEAWNMNMSMGGSKPHACMQHATLTRTHGRTQHSRTHAAHSTRRNTHAHARSTYSVRPWMTVHLEIYTLTRA